MRDTEPDLGTPHGTLGANSDTTTLQCSKTLKTHLNGLNARYPLDCLQIYPLIPFMQLRKTREAFRKRRVQLVEFRPQREG